MPAENTHPESGARPLTFRRRHRLGHNLEFAAVYGAKARKAAGPLVVFMRPNGLPQHRLGLAVGRRVGPAHVRVRFKRLLREAFRLRQHDLPRYPDLEQTGYDIVLSVRPHGGRAGVLPLERYERALLDGVDHLHTVWTRRAAKAKPGTPKPDRSDTDASS